MLGNNIQSSHRAKMPKTCGMKTADDLLIIVADVPNCGILAPGGAGGNHIRWLLLLDSRFQFDFYEQSERVQKALNYFIDAKEYKLLSNLPNDKAKNIAALVYSKKRTWHNWLAIEWYYRNAINNVIFFDHGNEGGWEKISNPIDSYKALLCAIDPDLSYKNYVKWNSNLSNVPIHQYKKEIENNFSAKAYSDRLYKLDRLAPCMIVDVSKLFQETLDKNFYQSIINFFQLEDHYNLAAELHSLWYNLNISAEKEMIQDLTKTFNLKE